MVEVRLLGSISGKLGAYWNPVTGDVVEVTADNAELLVRQNMAVPVGEVETRSTAPAGTADEPAKKPVKKAAAKRRRRKSGDS